MTYKISPDDKLSEVYAATTSSVSARDTTRPTSTITGNYCSPSCLAVYSNKTTSAVAIEHPNFTG